MRVLEMVRIPPVKLVKLCPLYKVFLRPVPRRGRGQLGVTAGTRLACRGCVGWNDFCGLVHLKVLGFLPKNDFSMMVDSHDPDQSSVGSPATG